MAVHIIMLYSIYHYLAHLPNMSVLSQTPCFRNSTCPSTHLCIIWKLDKKPSVSSSRSLTFNMRSSGPITDPYGIPLTNYTANQPEKGSLYSHFAFCPSANLLPYLEYHRLLSCKAASGVAAYLRPRQQLYAIQQHTCPSMIQLKPIPMEYLTPSPELMPESVPIPPTCLHREFDSMKAPCSCHRIEFTNMSKSFQYFLQR